MSGAIRNWPEYQMVSSGLIVVDDLRLAFPGNAEDVAESIRTRGPLPGKQEYQQLPEADPDHVEVMGPHNVESIRGSCVPTHLAHHWCEKEQWLKSLHLPGLGLVGYKDGQPVAIAEILPRELVPYPVPDYNGLFVTCLYGRYDAKLDYRRSMLRMGMPLLKGLGCAHIGIVAGRGTPFPNGPVELLAQAGFREAGELGRIILRHRWAEQVFMEREM